MRNPLGQGVKSFAYGFVADVIFKAIWIVYAQLNVPWWMYLYPLTAFVVSFLDDLRGMLTKGFLFMVGFTFIPAAMGDWFYVVLSWILWILGIVIRYRLR